MFEVPVRHPGKRASAWQHWPFSILARFCAQCAIRACAIERGLPNCAACAEFEGCARLHDFIRAEGEEVVRTMAMLRERLLARQREAGA